jgi:hypothetical protein
VNDLGKGSKAVGSTRSIGDDLVFGLVRLKVDTTNEPGAGQYTFIQDPSRLTSGRQQTGQR